jgi:hypothetical protein
MGSQHSKITIGRVCNQKMKQEPTTSEPQFHLSVAVELPLDFIEEILNNITTLQARSRLMWTPVSRRRQNNSSASLLPTAESQVPSIQQIQTEHLSQHSTNLFAESQPGGAHVKGMFVETQDFQNAPPVVESLGSYYSQILRYILNQTEAEFTTLSPAERAQSRSEAPSQPARNSEQLPSLADSFGVPPLGK